ncbi:Y-family DNA polymerase [Zobellia nedashkovskayae]
MTLIIGGGTNRGTVAACSKEAAKFGVRVSMPTAYALKLCPNATVLKGDYGSYSNKSKELTEIIREHAPVVEKSSIHSFYLDITGMDRFFGCYDWTKELSARISKNSGLVIFMGAFSQQDRFKDWSSGLLAPYAQTFGAAACSAFSKSFTYSKITEHWRYNFSVIIKDRHSSN